MTEKTNTDGRNEPMPQLLMPLFTDANRVAARAESRNWGATDEMMFDVLIALSGKNYFDAMRALMAVVATNISVASPNGPAQAVRGAEAWCEDLLDDVRSRADFFQRLKTPPSRSGPSIALRMAGAARGRRSGCRTLGHPAAGSAAVGLLRRLLELPIM
jgi:hypothetical protein